MSNMVCLQEGFDMSFEIPKEAFRNNTIYHQFGADYSSNIFGCGFLNKTGKECKENNNVYKHYGAVLVLSGKAVQIDYEGNQTEIGPGCLIQRIPEKRQTLIIHQDGSWLEFFVCISKNMYDALIAMDLLDRDQTVLYPGFNRALYDECNEFLYLMKNTHPTEINMLLPEALKVILMLHGLHKQNGTSSKDREIIQKACLFLSNPTSYNCSLQELAKDLGIGYEKFRKLFKSQTGTSPGNYLMQKKMDYAKTCLIEKNKSIKEISIELGFSDAYAFSKQFHKVVGLSPSDFRRDY